ncbi:MAG: polyprenyl synthetase family protein, partial [Ktedonobacteraceae bacterium]|nr:polyprenyl synthetase family protein [Ktedonobacteraceae bacterium]
MVTSSTVQATLQRHQQAIDTALRSTLNEIAAQGGTDRLEPHYGQMRYHLGWVDEHFVPTSNNPGKLLRPTLLILAYEVAGAWELSSRRDYIQRALPAAVAVELTHNFSLIHDDIEDGDEERRHRKTLWKIWGIPQAINTGDGMFAMARLALWNSLEQGVE